MTDPMTIDRRQALARLSAMFGAALTAPLVTGVLSGAEASVIPAGKAGKSFSAEEAMFLEVIADLIIPRTDTPSAGEAGAVGFVDSIIHGYEDAKGRKNFKAGLKKFYAKAEKDLGGCFVSSGKEDQFNWLQKVDQMAFAQQDAIGRFYRGLKRQIVAGYYVSEPGASEELNYLGVPGPFQGDIPVTADTRAWAN